MSIYNQLIWKSLFLHNVFILLNPVFGSIMLIVTIVPRSTLVITRYAVRWDKWMRWGQKPNSWIYSFGGVSRHNLESSFQARGFCIQCLHYKRVSQFQTTFAQGWLWIARGKTLKTFVQEFGLWWLVAPLLMLFTLQDLQVQSLEKSTQKNFKGAQVGDFRPIFLHQ